MILEKIKNLKSDYRPKFKRNVDGDIEVTIVSANRTLAVFDAFAIILILISVLMAGICTYIVSKTSLPIHFSTILGYVLIALLGTGISSTLLGRYQIKGKILRLTPDERYLVRLLAQFIRSNRLYLKDSVDGSIVYAATTTAHINSKFLTIALSSDGSSETQKTQNMEAELSSLLGLTLTDKKINALDTAYIFQLHRPKRLSIRDLKPIPAGTPIAIDSEHNWDYVKTPHILVAGRTGGGKTRYLLWIIANFVMQGCADSTFIIDPKKSDIFQLSTTGVFPPEHFATSPAQVCKLLRILNEDMDKCYQKINDSGVYGATYKDVGVKPTILIFDEFVAFFSSCTPKEKSEAMSYLKRLILMGRQAGITVCLSTQKPLAEDVPSAIRDNLSCRCAIGGLTDEGYRTVFGPAQITYQSCAPGNGYVYMDGQNYSVPQLVQFPFIPNINELIQVMKDNPYGYVPH